MNCISTVQGRTLAAGLVASWATVVPSGALTVTETLGTSGFVPLPLALAAAAAAAAAGAGILFLARAPGGT